MSTRTYSQAFLSRPAARAQRLVALTVGVLLVFVVAWIGASGPTQPLPHLPAFGAVFLVSIALAQGFTGLLLGLQAAHLRHPTLALLAGAYTFLAVVSTFLLLISPGVISIHGWPQVTSTINPWMMMMTRYFFPCWVLLAVWQIDRKMKRWVLWMAWLVPSLLAPTLGYLVVTATHLQPLIFGQNYGHLLRHTLLPLNLVLVLAVLIVTVALTHLRTRLHLWLAVVLLAQFCSLALATLGGAQDTVGWYAARGMSAVSAVVLLGALLWDIHDIHMNLQRINARLHDDATQDGLTGLLMHRPFMALLRAAMGPRRVKGTPCALLLLDVDHFKAYNDTFGHMAGDACLTALAHTLRNTAPKQGASVARQGGEEFAVLLTGPAAEQAAKVAENLRTAVLREDIRHARSSGQATVSISVGWGRPTPYMTVETFFDQVDKALYAAKRAGRNCVREMGAAEDATATPAREALADLTPVDASRPLAP
jgi:diguanylate cyclase (GGDEF)-like protein